MIRREGPRSYRWNHGHRGQESGTGTLVATMYKRWDICRFWVTLPSNCVAPATKVVAHRVSVFCSQMNLPCITRHSNQSPGDFFGGTRTKRQKPKSVQPSPCMFPNYGLLLQASKLRMPEMIRIGPFWS